MRGQRSTFSDEDDATLIRMYEAGASFRLIAEKLGRPLGTISNRASNLRTQGVLGAKPKKGSAARPVNMPPPTAGGEGGWRRPLRLGPLKYEPWWSWTCRIVREGV